MDKETKIIRKIELIETKAFLRFRHAFCCYCQKNTHSVTVEFNCGHVYCVDCAYELIYNNEKCRKCYNYLNNLFKYNKKE